VARILIGMVVVGVSGTMACTAKAAVLLETNRSCDGALLSTPQRLELVGWDGDSRRALGEKVYDYRVRCDDGEREGIDLFLAAERSDRFKREGNVLMHLKRTERQSVKIKDAGCRQVPKQVQVPPPDDEIRATCRNQRMPMACEIDMLAQRRWVTQMVEECWRAKYETREVPIWEAFPENYAPLPRGARLVTVAATPPAVTGTEGTTSPPTPSGGGSPLGVVLVVALLAGVSFYYVRRRNKEKLREEVASARSQMGGEQADFGASFRSEGERKDGFHSSSARDEQRYSDASERESTFESGRQTRYEGNAEEEKRSPDDVPRTLEEACALLNVTTDTPPDEINRIYKAMAMVWHVDKVTSEADRKRHEAKMKQLNAAKDLLLGKR
jgi:hypothetical protein